MRFLSGMCTDIGIKKKTNQDAMLLQQATTDYGEVVFAAVCDGMGGLKKGEVASAELILACSRWFKEYFPTIISSNGINTGKLQSSWLDLMRKQDEAISRYGAVNGFSLGTTMTCILIFNNQYYVANIGDSRVYLLSDQIYQITHDHTLVQQKIDNGTLTVEQALVDPKRSVLLQCIGASDYVEPDFFSGTVKGDACFLLCCDGFRHMITPAEIYSNLKAPLMSSQSVIENRILELIKVIKGRGETDNISALLIRCLN